jgi:hypothetical protein
MIQRVLTSVFREVDVARKKKKTSGGGTLFGKPRDEVVKRPGAFKAKAKAAGKSTSALASKVLKKGSKASTRTKRQAALAKAFATMRRKKKRKR